MNFELRVDPALRGKVPEGSLRRAVREALIQGGAPERAALTLLVSGDEAVRVLNRDHAGIDAPTDVLSFPSGETGEDPTGERYLGDIVISIDRAAAQAEQAGHALDAEMQLLAVHGVLHLLGHDHGDPDEKAAMWEVQARILEKLGNPAAPA